MIPGLFSLETKQTLLLEIALPGGAPVGRFAPFENLVILHSIHTRGIVLNRSHHIQTHAAHPFQLRFQSRGAIHVPFLVNVHRIIVQGHLMPQPLDGKVLVGDRVVTNHLPPDQFSVVGRGVQKKIGGSNAQFPFDFRLGQRGHDIDIHIVPDNNLQPIRFPGLGQNLPEGKKLDIVSLQQGGEKPMVGPNGVASDPTPFPLAETAVSEIAAPVDGLQNVIQRLLRGRRLVGVKLNFIRHGLFHSFESGFFPGATPSRSRSESPPR